MECRYCEYKYLNGGDIYECMKTSSVWKNATDEEVKVGALNRGWSETNNKQYQKEIIVQYNEKTNVNVKEMYWIENKCFPRIITIQCDENLQILVCPKCDGIFPRDNNKPKTYFIYNYI